MNPKLNIVRIIADNDQDREQCKEWWRGATEEHKLIVWNRIQKRHADPVDEIVSRFAQLAFAEMMTEMAGAK